MAQAEVFPFVVTDPAFGEASRLPYMPITLQLQGRSLSVSALLDTGSAVNVLPYEAGVQLGAVWEQQTTTVRYGLSDRQLGQRSGACTYGIGDRRYVACGSVGIRLDSCP